MVKPDYIKPELAAKLATYKMVEDCYQGSEAVKGRHAVSNPSVNNGGGSTQSLAISPYLPDPSPSNEDYNVRVKRYNDYVTRAVFYNVTKRTVNAMSGAVFSKYPTMTLGELTVLETDADGGGQSLTQMARDALNNGLMQARGVFLADMPVNDGLTKAQMVAQGIRPTIAHYDSTAVINWRYRQIGGIKKLSLIVFSESYETEDDGFEQKLGHQILVLRLNDQNKAESEIYRRDDGGKWVSQGINPMYDYDGQQLDEIRAYPYGAVNNDLEPDDVPMADIAHLNISHLRNSADYEESLAISQPTLAISGLTQEWVNDVLSNGVAMGSRSGIMLPVGGKAELLQPNVNDSNMTAMKHKEDMMVSLGAKLIEQGASANMTATQANNNRAEETSVLSSIANNVSDALTKCIKACARFMGFDDKDLVFALNTDFGFAKMTPEQRQILMQEWQAGAITFGEMRSKLVESEIGELENPEDARDTIKQEQANLMLGDEVE